VHVRLVELPEAGVTKPLEIKDDDGSTTIVSDELKLQRILRALRKPGPLYVHELPHEEPDERPPAQKEPK